MCGTLWVCVRCCSRPRYFSCNFVKHPRLGRAWNKAAHGGGTWCGGVEGRGCSVSKAFWKGRAGARVGRVHVGWGRVGTAHEEMYVAWGMGVSVGKQRVNYCS